MRYFLTFCIIALSSCGSAVITDYDTSADFGGYTSYDFYPGIESGLGELDEKRVMKAIDSLLTERGMVKQVTPDLLVNFFVSEQLAPSRSTIGIGIGGGGRNMGVGVSGGIPIGGNTIEQRFTLDFVDRVNDRLVWQGVADSDLSERASAAEKEAYYYVLLKKILKKYPPANTK
jgi:hypothetical protein